MSPGKDNVVGNPVSKLSSKSKWRQNKYSHKKKVQQFEERRRKAALHKYYKELKKSGNTSLIPGQKGESKEEDKEESSECHSKGRPKGSNSYERAKQELERRKKEKEQLRADRERDKAEREEAIKKYKKEKMRKYQKLKMKTKKGQPLMAGRMELLLEKVQRAVGVS